MGILINVLISALAVVVSAYIIPGVKVDGFLTAIVVAIVLAIVNAFVKPVILFLTLPINILTFGLFTIVVNALMILLVSAIVPGFAVNGILNALLFVIVLSLVNGVLFMMSPAKNK